MNLLYKKILLLISLAFFLLPNKDPITGAKINAYAKEAARITKTVTGK